MNADKAAIDAIMREFFAAFASPSDGPVSLASLRRMFLARAVIVRNAGARPEVMSVGDFIAPRETLLNDGSLVEFREVEEAETTQIFGNIAQRFSTYRKSGRLNGSAFSTRGRKTVQFVRDDGAWKISALAWDDERD